MPRQTVWPHRTQNALFWAYPKRCVLTYNWGLFFLTPIVAGMHLAGGALESPSGWSTSAVWVGLGWGRRRCAGEWVDRRGVHRWGGGLGVSGFGGGEEMGLGWGGRPIPVLLLMNVDGEFKEVRLDIGVDTTD